MTFNFSAFNTNIQSQPQLLTLSANVNSNINNVDSFDIYLGSDGNLSTSNNDQAVAESCAESAATLLGEIVLNVNEGLPYFQVVWIGVPNLQQYEGALKNAFLNVSGGNYVTGVPFLVSKFEDNILTYNAIIQTIYGNTTLTGSVTGATNA